jgi:hypothetical protein
MSARYILFNLFLVVVSELVLCCHDMSCATIYFVGIGCQGGGLGGGGIGGLPVGFSFLFFGGEVVVWSEDGYNEDGYNIYLWFSSTLVFIAVVLFFGVVVIKSQLAHLARIFWLCRNHVVVAVQGPS